MSGNHRRTSPGGLTLLLVAVLFAASCASGTKQGAASGIGDTTPAAAAELLRARSGDTGPVLLDVRTPGEFAADRIPGARNIDFESPSFRQELAALDKDREYVVYCRSGRRSSSSLDTFRELGFTRVLNVKGGLNAWKSAQLPVEANTSR